MGIGAPAATRATVTLFPQHDANGNDINPPVDKNFTATTIGIGFKADPNGDGSLTLADNSTPANAIYLYDNSTLEVAGANLNAALLDAGFVDANGISLSEYSLSGLLANGVEIPAGMLLYVANPTDTNPTGASFTFVAPEPALGMMLPVFALCAEGVLHSRRRHPR
jgi:hypothetical protein